MMIQATDKSIIANLRSNGRKKVTEIARLLKMPVSTVHDRISSHARKGVLKKHTTLIDFNKLGYQSLAIIALKAQPGRREALQVFLTDHPNINSLYRVNGGHDFLLEAVFEGPAELSDFIDELKANQGAELAGLYEVLKEIKKECFLSNEEKEEKLPHIT